MAKRDEFDDEGFFDSLLNRKGKTDLPPGLRRIFIVIALLVLVSVLVSVVVASWPSGNDGADTGNLPIIHADATPLKVKPQDPGGMPVPNKDSTIFETLKGDKEDGKVENLLEDPSDTAASVAREQVVAKVEKKAEPLVDVKLEKTGTPPDADLEDVPPQPEPAQVEVKKEDVKEIPAKEAMKAPAKEPMSIIDTLKQDSHPKKEIPKKAETAAAIKPASGGSTYIQLASVKSEADASKQWSAAKSKNPELAGLSMKVQKADLGDKGIFYRVQAGPLTPASATSACAAIKSRGGNCLIAK